MIKEITFNNCEINEPVLDFKKQVEVINSIYLNNEHPLDKKFNVCLRNKLNSYKCQDVKKNSFDPNNFITFDDMVEKLVESKLKCFHCNNNVYILYNKRQSDQWTLDRINNNYGHNKDNVVIACMNCNLKRRRTKLNIFKKNIIKSIVKIT